MMHDRVVRTRQTQINIESWHLGHPAHAPPSRCGGSPLHTTDDQRWAGLCRCSWTWLKECLGFVLWSLGTGCFPPVA